MSISGSTKESKSEQRGPITNLIYQIQIVVIVAFLLATLFTAWTPASLASGALAEKFPSIIGGKSDANQANWPTPTPRPRARIGIVAGHWGNDSGAVCSDGLTELEINLNIATLVQKKLTDRNFEVDLLKEFDPLLDGYQSLALVSIHADSCDYINDMATGYKVSAAKGSTQPEKAARLTACLRTRYSQATNLPFHANSITVDMSSYHAFDEIHNETTAAIIETGFLNLDRQILTQQPEQIADGIVNGIICYLYNEDISATPQP